MKQFVESKKFQNLTLAVILFASILVGLETSSYVKMEFGRALYILDLLVQAFFTFEILARILAYGRKPFNFFKSGMNIFDFIVTAIFYMPFGGAYASVFRLIRILRVFRLFTALPKLQILVGALLRGVPSMGYIAVLLTLQLYIFAVVGTNVFGVIDPVNFGTIGRSMMALFQILTLEGWVDIYNGLGKTPFATVYFVSFILLGTMVVLNLFIGVITSGFDEVKKEVEEANEKEAKVLEKIVK